MIDSDFLQSPSMLPTVKWSRDPTRHRPLHLQNPLGYSRVSVQRGSYLPQMGVVGYLPESQVATEGHPQPVIEGIYGEWLQASPASMSTQLKHLHITSVNVCKTKKE